MNRRHNTSPESFEGISDNCNRALISGCGKTCLKALEIVDPKSSDRDNFRNVSFLAGEHCPVTRTSGVPLGSLGGGKEETINNLASYSIDDREVQL